MEERRRGGEEEKGTRGRSCNVFRMIYSARQRPVRRVRAVPSVSVEITVQVHPEREHETPSSSGRAPEDIWLQLNQPIRRLQT
ncbi:hypothetical protein MHYP_G00242910 [Metynnis hypsauchen]